MREMWHMRCESLSNENVRYPARTVHYFPSA